MNIIVEVTMLEVDSSLVSFEIGASQQQSAPTIDVTEVRKGSTGNSIVDPDQVTVDFTLSHDIEPGVGIDRAAVHILTCAYSAKAIAANDPSGSFHISVFDKRITVNAQSNMSQLKNLLRAELSLVDAVSTAGSSYGTVCRFDANNPVTAVTKLTFSSAERAFPEVSGCVVGAHG
jgi:glycyl-tRNA synthetase (class II)